MFHRKKKFKRFGEREWERPTAAPAGQWTTFTIFLFLPLFGSFMNSVSSKWREGEAHSIRKSKRISKIFVFLSPLVNLTSKAFRSLDGSLTVGSIEKWTSATAFNTHLTNQRITLKLESAGYIIAFAAVFLSHSPSRFVISDYLIWLGQLFSFERVEKATSWQHTISLTSFSHFQWSFSYRHTFPKALFVLDIERST